MLWNYFIIIVERGKNIIPTVRFPKKSIEKQMKIVNIIYQAGTLTESTPNLTIGFLHKTVKHSYTFSMIKPLHLKGDYKPIQLSPIKCFSMKCIPFVLLQFRFCIKYITHKKSHNILWVKTNMLNLLRFIYLFHFIKKNNITHLNCFFGNIGEFFVQLTIFLPLKVTVSFHGVDASDSMLKGYFNIKKYCDAYFVLAEHMKFDLLKRGFRKELIHVIKTGLNFSSMPLYDTYSKKNQIVYVGRLVEKKAILDAIFAFSLISQKFSQYSFIVVGDGPLMEKAKKTTHELSLTGRIFFLGSQLPERVYQIMLESKVFLLPSKTAPTGDKEGAPVSIIEAQVLGLPVVSTFHAGIPEIVIPDKTALLSNEGDIAKIAQGIECLLEDESLLKSFSKRAIDYSRSRFDITRRITEIIEVLQGL